MIGLSVVNIKILMQIQDSKTYSYLFFSLVLLITIDAASLSVMGILGYSGFEDTGVQPSPITFANTCSEGYYADKYQTNQLSGLLNRTYLIVFSSSMLGIVSLLILASFVCCSKSTKGKIYLKETDEDQLPGRSQTVFLYLSLLLNLLISVFPFKTYISFQLEQNNQVCQLNMKSSEVQIITALCAAQLAINVLCMSFGECLRRNIVRQRKRRENGHLSPTGNKRLQFQTNQLKIHESQEQFNDIIRISDGFSKNYQRYNIHSVFDVTCEQCRQLRSLERKKQFIASSFHIIIYLISHLLWCASDPYLPSPSRRQGHHIR